MRTACYCRVSTKKGEQLDSLNNQIEFFEELTKQKQYDLYKIYADEGISGKQLSKRLEFQKMMKDARLKKFEAILVKDVTRFSRNIIDFLNSIRELKELEINVFFTSYDMNIKEADETYLSILAIMAEDESRRLSVKTKFGKNITAKKGRVPNFVFGYDKVDRYTIKPNPVESLIVLEIFDLYVNKKLGTAKIARYLTEKGIKTKKNNQTGWTQKTVIDILRNEIYIGNVINKKSEIVNLFTGKRKMIDKDLHVIVKKPEFQIVDLDLFNQTQLILEQRVNSFNLLKKKISYKYIFSNLLKCNECGYSFRRCKRKYSENGKEYIWWVCSYRNAHGVGSCLNNVKIYEDKLESSIKEFFALLIRNKKELSRQIFLIIKELITKDEKESPFENVELKINKLITDKEKYMDMYKHEIINMEELKNYINPLKEKIEDYKRLLVNIEKKNSYSDREIQDAVDDFLKNIEGNLEIDNIFLKTIIDEIKVDTDGQINLAVKFGGIDDLTIDIPFSLSSI